MADDRRLTLIVVPHGDLETRTLEIAYWKLKIGLILAIVLLLGFGFVVATWFPIAAQASRVPGLERDLAALEKEREQVAELADALAEVEAQYERVRQLLGADGSGRDGDPILPPLARDSARVVTPADTQDAATDTVAAVVDAWPLASAGFVTRAQSSGRVGHPGLDVAVPRNSEIRAAGPGVVREAGEDAIYGQYALIDHGGGLQSLYGHASRIVVTSGERIGRAQIIGYTGSSGRSSGPHLHFEVRKDGIPVDPLQYVKQP
jgi:murein DD-endopeptidase MepM/ murein hydrolase activator NlpD